MYSVYLDFWQSHAWFIHNLHLDHLYYCLDKQVPIAWRNESTTAASALAWPRRGGGGGVGYSTKFYTVKLCPGASVLTLPCPTL